MIDNPHVQRPVNTPCHCQFLHPAIAAYGNKRLDMLIRDAIRRHNNARPHTAVLAKNELREISWETLEHLPYNPDLSLSN